MKKQLKLRRKHNKENKTLRETTVELGYFTNEEFAAWVKPENKVGDL